MRIGAQTEQKYRNRTAKAGIVFSGVRTCQGPCHRSRSVAQFAAGDVLCARCRLRSKDETRSVGAERVSDQPNI